MTPANKSDDLLSTDVATLQTQLRLARAQNAYLHGRLQAAGAPAASPSTTDLVPTGHRGPEGDASLEDDNRRLRARLEQAKTVFREQEARYASLVLAYEEERKNRIHYEDRATRLGNDWSAMYDKAKDLEDQLKRAGIPPRPHYQWLDRGPSLPDILTALLTLAHPDKWSQGQPATALAHELTLAINKVRQQGRGQP